MQLEATLRECIETTELRAFLVSHEKQAEFFQKGKEVKAKRLSLNSNRSDIIKETAERIYQIRCRIVHTKVSAEDEDDSPLLPYTEEERFLYFDIRLIKFIAFKVITSSGAALKVL